MNVFGIGLPEMALIMVVALLIFGPKKLPEIGRSMGKAIRSFQDASKEFEDEFKREAEQIETAVKTTAEIEPKQINPAPNEAENIAQNPLAAETESQAVTTSEPS
jgi:sec-independent protein translocase protein TatA